MLAHPITLFVDGYFTSTWDAACYVTLIEKHLEFTTARALLRDGQGVPAALHEHTAIARIPAFQHGDFWLTESLAVVEYLEDAFPPPQHPSVFPSEPQQRGRMRQIMSWLRSDMVALRIERPWQCAIYAIQLPALSPAAERYATELCDLVARLETSKELPSWTIAHAELAFALLRLVRGGREVPEIVQQFLDRELARPSVRSYLDHARPPHPPPYARS